MNETLATEAAYFKAIGIDTEYYDKEAELECLRSAKTKEPMYGLVYESNITRALMLSHEINIEFHPSEVWASHPDIPTNHCVRYGGAQWKSKQWAFGMAVVQAVTDKLERVNNAKT